MRICNQCQIEMIDDFDIKIDNAAYGIKLTTKGIFGKKIAKPKVAICPTCGNINMYINDIENELKKVKK